MFFSATFINMNVNIPMIKFFAYLYSFKYFYQMPIIYK